MNNKNDLIEALKNAIEAIKEYECEPEDDFLVAILQWDANNNSFRIDVHTTGMRR